MAGRISYLAALSKGKYDLMPGNLNPTFHSLFTAIFILALLAFLPPWLASGQESLKATQSDVSLSESVSRLEAALNLENSKSATLILRLANLETKVFGGPQKGGLKERISKLDQTVFASDNYFPTVIHSTNNKIMRFRQLPIPVLINKVDDQNYMQACIGGFEMWEKATDGLVRFTQVDDATVARIKVVWAHLGADTDASGCSLGAHTITKWQEKPKTTLGQVQLAQMPIPLALPRIGKKYSVPPQIIEVNLDLINSRSPSTRYQLLQNVVAHELGHALGLLGHSPNKEDMMYSQTDENSKLTARDINTIRRLYQQNHIDIAL